MTSDEQYPICDECGDIYPEHLSDCCSGNNMRPKRIAEMQMEASKTLRKNINRRRTFPQYKRNAMNWTTTCKQRSLNQQRFRRG